MLYCLCTLYHCMESVVVWITIYIDSSTLTYVWKCRTSTGIKKAKYFRNVSFEFLWKILSLNIPEMHDHLKWVALLLERSYHLCGLMLLFVCISFLRLLYLFGPSVKKRIKFYSFIMILWWFQNSHINYIGIDYQ